MKILFLNRCYWPDTEATGQLLTELCESLAVKHDVTVITGQPNISMVPADEHYIQSGEQIRNGVRILRVQHAQWPKHKTWSRLANLASFTAAAYRRLRKHPAPDLIVSETDPFFLPLIAARYAKRRKIPMVAYLQDIYPDVAIAVEKARDSRATRFLRRQLQKSYQAAERIIVLSESMSQRLHTWGEIEKDRIHIVPNWIDTHQVGPWVGRNAFREDFAPQDAFVVMHSGNMGLTQPLDTLIRSTAESEFPENGQVVLVGTGCREPEWRDLADKTMGERIVFRGYQPKAKLAESLSACDLHIVASDPRVDGCLAPSKLYGILAAGKPTLVIGSCQSDAAKFVIENRLGRCVPPDPKAIARAIREMAAEPELLMLMGQRARLMAEEQFDRRVVVRKLEDQFESAARRLPDRRQVTESMVAPTLPPVKPSSESSGYPGVARSSSDHRDFTDLDVEFESDSSKNASHSDSTVGSSF